MPISAEQRQVVLAYRSQTTALRSRIVRFIDAAWGRLSDWRDADIDRFVSSIVPVVEGAQLTMANLTDAYLAAYLGTAPVGVSRSSVSTEALRGVPAHEIYHRAGVTVWHALSNGSTLTDAVSQGLNRATSLATTTLQLSKTHTSQAVLGQTDGVVGYRRVLEGSKTCGLCAVAATQRYHVGELMPIHGGCDCGVAPIFGERDPGRVIDPDSLEGIRGELSERFGVTPDRINRADELRGFVVVQQHGELGPVLAVRGQEFTGPSDI